MSSDLKLGMKCIKYMLFAVNLTFVMTSMLLITSGGTIHAIYSDFRHFLSDTWFSPATIMIAVGVLMFFISAFGCWGAIKESTCMINTFGAMLAAIFVVEFAGAVAAFICQTQIAGIVAVKMETAVRSYSTAPVQQREAVDFLQERLFCCGINGAEDWEKLSPNISMPQSCCNKQYIPARSYGGDLIRMSSSLQFENGIPVYPSGLEAFMHQNMNNDEEKPDPEDKPDDDDKPDDEEKPDDENETTEKNPTEGPEESATEVNPTGTSPTESTTGGEVCMPHKSGCYKKLAFLINSSAAILGSGATAVALMQLLGMMCAFSLARAIRRAKTQRLMRQNWQQRMGQIIGMQATPYTQLQEKRGAENAPVTYAASDPSVL